MPCKCMVSVDVTLYDIPTSAEGQQARHFFERKGIPFTALDVSSDSQARQKLVELSGQQERPAIVIDERVIVGFDLSVLESAVPSFF
jgi:arsenate reductase-like glutaredoxin family protein